MLGYKTRFQAGGYRFWHIRIPTVKESRHSTQWQQIQFPISKCSDSKN